MVRQWSRYLAEEPSCASTIISSSSSCIWSIYSAAPDIWATLAQTECRPKRWRSGRDKFGEDAEGSRLMALGFTVNSTVSLRFGKDGRSVCERSQTLYYPEMSLAKIREWDTYTISHTLNLLKPQAETVEFTMEFSSQRENVAEIVISKFCDKTTQSKHLQNSYYGRRIGPLQSKLIAEWVGGQLATCRFCVIIIIRIRVQERRLRKYMATLSSTGSIDARQSQQLFILQAGRYIIRPS